MPGNDCIVCGCTSNSERDVSKGIHFFNLPAIKHDDPDVRDISIRRRLAWCIAISRKEITMQSCETMPWIQICSLHFLSGEPASLFDEKNLDWIPNLNLQLNRVCAEMMKYRIATSMSPSTAAKQRRTKKLAVNQQTLSKRSQDANLKAQKIETRSRHKQKFAFYRATTKKAKRERRQSRMKSSSSEHHHIHDESPQSFLVESTQENSANRTSLASSGGGLTLPSHAKCTEVPVMNHEVRVQLLSILQSIKHLPDRLIDKNRPLAVLSATISHDANSITWVCREGGHGRGTFTQRTPLVTKQNEGGRPLSALWTETNKLPRSRTSSNHMSHNDNTTDALNPVRFLPVECCGVMALLHMDKFHCPGMYRKCIELNGTFLTPVEMMQETCQDLWTDWENVIMTDGIPLGSAIRAQTLDFTNHSTFCTHLCPKSTDCLRNHVNNNNQSTEKQTSSHDTTDDMLIPSTFTMFMSKESRKCFPDSCCVPTCSNGYSKRGCEAISFFHLPREEDRCRIWVQNIGRVDLMSKTASELRQAGLRICSCHFEDFQFTYPAERNQLKSQAVPTLFHQEDSEANGILKWKSLSHQEVKSSLKRKLIPDTKLPTLQTGPINQTNCQFTYPTERKRLKSQAVPTLFHQENLQANVISKRTSIGHEEVKSSLKRKLNNKLSLLGTGSIHQTDSKEYGQTSDSIQGISRSNGYDESIALQTAPKPNVFFCIMK